MARILIVDDSPTEMYKLTAMLEKHGHQVLKAENGADGVALARQEKPDAVLMDIVMPAMDGCDAVVHAAALVKILAPAEQFDRINVEKREKYAGNVVQMDLHEGKETVIYKYAAVLSSENHPKGQLVEACHKVLDEAVRKGFDKLFEEHAKVWAHKWEECDITIEGDVAAQTEELASVTARAGGIELSHDRFVWQNTTTFGMPWPIAATTRALSMWCTARNR